MGAGVELVADLDLGKVPYAAAAVGPVGLFFLEPQWLAAHCSLAYSLHLPKNWTCTTELVEVDWHPEVHRIIH